MSTENYLADLLNDLNYAEDDLPDNLVPFIGFLISKAAQAIVANVDESLASFGITSRHYGIMIVLNQQAGLPQIAIAEKLRIDRTTMVKLVDVLEKEGFVERHRDPNDRRAYALSLSATGQKMLPKLTETVINEEKTALSKLNQDEVRTLFKLLVKLQ